MSSAFISNAGIPNSSLFENNLLSLLLTFLLTFNIVYSQNLTNETISTTPSGQVTTNFYSSTTTDPTTSNPTLMPTTANPTLMPVTADPTLEPTSNPTSTPTTAAPTTAHPSLTPSRAPTGTFYPTVEPTLSPSSKPTATPTDGPTPAGISDDKYKLSEVGVVCRGNIDAKKVRKNEATWISFFFAGFPFSAEERKAIRVVIGIIKEILGSSRRRLLTSEVVGVEIQYLVAINDARTFNTFKQTINTGEFKNNYEQAIDDNYDGIDVDDDIAIIDRGEGDPDEFLGEEEPTFGEIISSPFILLGIVCTIVGIIWLLFLRSTIENNYPSYLVQPNNESSGGNAVEMVPQTSSASADDTEKKKQNKQELQQAWNDSDAEVN